MNTKLLMGSSALLLILAGLVLTFIPREISASAGMVSSSATDLFLQVMGALLFGFGVLNWMAKGSLIGGIYNKPIATANFAHFLIVSIAMLKVILSNKNLSLPFFVLAGIYVLFAILFGIVWYTSPVGKKEL